MVATPPFNENWTPFGKDFLDMRLTRSSTFEDNLFLFTYSKKVTKISAFYTQASSIDATGLNQLAKNAPKLKMLNLNCYGRLTNLTISAIAEFKHLTELNLSNVHGLLFQDANCYLLEINDSMVKEITYSCTQIERLDLSHSMITIDTLINLFSLQHLRYLRIHACHGITDDCLLKFKKFSHFTIDNGTNNDPTDSYIELFNHAKKNFFEKTDYNYKLKKKYADMLITVDAFRNFL